MGSQKSARGTCETHLPANSVNKKFMMGNTIIHKPDQEDGEVPKDDE